MGNAGKGFHISLGIAITFLFYLDVLLPPLPY